MPVEKSLDYIQCSASIAESEVIAAGAKKINPTKFYQRGYVDENQTRYYFGNPNSKKALIIASGHALEALREVHFTDNQIITSLIEKDAKFTRLDYAITIHNDENIFTLGDIQDDYRNGLIDSPLVKRGGMLISKLELDGNVYPETFYIGELKKRGEHGIFRAYDKGAQFDISRFMLMRAELEERGEKAHNSAKRIADGASVSSVFKSRFNIRSGRWENIFDCESVSIDRGKNKERELTPEERRWKWLIEQVAPALKQAILSENCHIGESENFAKFAVESGLSEKIRELALYMFEKKQ